MATATIAIAIAIAVTVEDEGVATQEGVEVWLQSTTTLGTERA